MEGQEVIGVSQFRIAICEDDQTERTRLASLCSGLLSDRGIAHQIHAFPSADALIQELERGCDPFDLFLLDIQMEGTDGLELARQLYRQGVRDKVIFVTGSAEYALAGYDAHPLHYLLKPVGRERLEEALALVLERQPQTVLFQRGGRTMAFPLRELRYLESRNHGVVLHLKEEEQPLSISLAEAEQLVPAGAFRRCHKSYLVNLEWVGHITRTEVCLRDGERLPVSRTFYADFQSALIHYLNHPKA